VSPGCEVTASQVYDGIEQGAGQKVVQQADDLYIDRIRKR